MSGFLAAVREVWLEAPLKHTLTILGLSAFIGYGFYNYYVRGGKLRRHHRYTIATVYKTHWSVKSGKFADSRYQVQGRDYLVSADADKLAGQELIGRRFLVEYHPPDPTINVLLLGAPVPDSLATAPPDGWAQPPVTIVE
ncbi:hypothetical protein QMK33_06015 [Hymenobacter sp. H14-R3]|uniref:hypothetical protein n=1 Tax=Hymenobacter sp. H14-R3 TaxID=3046308 RepID=UPI0024B8F021|nr:hypothetical protein [Hymenobacter sp. H14-R3]MDJ0364702.1 hypothetical protein [Hymenobacter sp. H14-R3]